jgi:hypothetical protein
MRHSALLGSRQTARACLVTLAWLVHTRFGPNNAQAQVGLHWFEVTIGVQQLAMRTTARQRQLPA